MHAIVDLFALCCRFLTARVSHAIQLSSPDSAPVLLRAFGFLGTFASILTASLLNVTYAIHNKN